MNLPRDKGISTKVPLIMCLHSQKEEDGIKAELSLEFNSKTMSTTEETVAKDIRRAAVDIAGGGNAISMSIKLVIKKKGVTHITQMDLPVIVKLLVKGQPQDIFSRIKSMIMKYTEPEESIILTVRSTCSAVDTCESLQ